MGMLIDGIWSEKDKAPGSDGKFVRPDSIFRNWVTLDGSPGPTGEGGYKAEAGSPKTVIFFLESGVKQAEP